MHSKHIKHRCGFDDTEFAVVETRQQKSDDVIVTFRGQRHGNSRVGKGLAEFLRQKPVPASPYRRRINRGDRIEVVLPEIAYHDQIARRTIVSHLVS